MNSKFLKIISVNLAALSLMASLNTAHAEDTVSEDRSSHFGIGFDIDSYENNYGVGLTLSSPRFFDDSSMIQLTADIAWVQGVQNTATTTSWEPYGLFKLGYFRGRFIEGT